MTYSLVCAEGHEPMTLTVSADNDEAAMPMMVEKVHAHHREFHPEMANMSDEEVMDYVNTHWTKSEV